MLRVIGDIHGDPSDPQNEEVYLRFVQAAEYSLQVGDLGLHYDFLRDVDPERHRFIGGNHDNYDIIGQQPHCLGDFGVFDAPTFGPIFFVRGAWSIDRKARREFPQYDPQTRQLLPKNWWAEEELSTAKGYEALELYKQVKPKVVISHDCPNSVVPHVSDPMTMHRWGYSQTVMQSRTNLLLQAMTDEHRPRLHVFGHYHRNFDRFIDGVTGDLRPDNFAPDDSVKYTRYMCINTFNRLDFADNFVDFL